MQRAGIQPIAISVDAPAVSGDLARKAGYTFPILSDANAAVARQYDLLHKGAGMKGADIARPAEFLIDKSGTVRWRNLTEDYRVRLRPETVIEEMKRTTPGRAENRPPASLARATP